LLLLLFVIVVAVLAVVLFCFVWQLGIIIINSRQTMLGVGDGNKMI